MFVDGPHAVVRPGRKREAQAFAGLVDLIVLRRAQANRGEGGHPACCHREGAKSALRVIAHEIPCHSAVARQRHAHAHIIARPGAVDLRRDLGDRPFAQHAGRRGKRHNRFRGDIRNLQNKHGIGHRRAAAKPRHLRRLRRAQLHAHTLRRFHLLIAQRQKRQAGLGCGLRTAGEGDFRGGVERAVGDALRRGTHQPVIHTEYCAPRVQGQWHGQALAAHQRPPERDDNLLPRAALGESRNRVPVLPVRPGILDRARPEGQRHGGRVIVFNGEREDFWVRRYEPEI